MPRVRRRTFLELGLLGSLSTLVGTGKSAALGQVVQGTVDFGALTPAGHGGYSLASGIDEARIIAGDTGLQWQISSSGILTPSQLGAEAKLSGGPFRLIIEVHQEGAVKAFDLQINIVPKTYSVANSEEFADWLALSDLVRSGSTCAMRPGSYICPPLAGKFHESTMSEVCTITSHERNFPAQLDWFRLIPPEEGAYNAKIRLAHLTFFAPYSRAGKRGIIAPRVKNMTIESCDFRSDLVPGRIKNIWRSYTYECKLHGENIALRHCTFAYVVHCMAVSGHDIDVIGNYAFYCWGDFCNLIPFVTPKPFDVQPTYNVQLGENLFHDSIHNTLNLHTDFLQTFSYNQIEQGGSEITDVTIEKNIVWLGWEGANGSLEGTRPPNSAISIQAILMQGVSTKQAYKRWNFLGNIFWVNSRHGITSEKQFSGPSLIKNNSLLNWLTKPTTDYLAPAISNGKYYWTPDVSLENNVAEAIESGVARFINNDFRIDHNHRPTYVSRLMATDMMPLTRDDCIAQARIRSGGPLDKKVNKVADIGAVGTTPSNGYVNWDEVQWDDPAMEDRFDIAGHLINAKDAQPGEMVQSNEVEIVGLTGSGCFVIGDNGAFQVRNAQNDIVRDWAPANRGYNVVNGYKVQFALQAPYESGQKVSTNIRCGAKGVSWSVTTA